MGGGACAGCDLHCLHRHCHSPLQEVRSAQWRKTEINAVQ